MKEKSFSYMEEQKQLREKIFEESLKAKQMPSLLRAMVPFLLVSISLIYIMSFLLPLLNQE